MLGMTTAAHQEIEPESATPLISKMSCTISGSIQAVELMPESIVHGIYGQGTVRETFLCNYGLNSQFQNSFEKGPLKISGRDEQGCVRVVELSQHQFYVATLFMPQIASKPESPHPIFVAFLKSALLQ